MSIVIASTALSEPDAALNSIEHSVAAGLACPGGAGLTVHDIDLLVNVGVYRHHNMCEPSVCALIQHEMKMCPDFRKYPVERNVFSFDLTNAGCGTLSAVMALQSMLEVRQLDRAMIVSSDCPPSGSEDKTFPINPMGSALLLSRIGGKGQGFQPVKLKTSTEGGDGQTGSCDIARHGIKSRNTVDVRRADGYLDRLQRFAREVVNKYIDDISLDRGSTVKLVCSQPSASFGPELATGLQLRENALISTFEDYGDVHTSSLSLGYHVGLAEGRIEASDSVLFVEAGGGLTVACALYIPPAPAQ